MKKSIEIEITLSKDDIHTKVREFLQTQDGHLFIMGAVKEFLQTQDGRDIVSDICQAEMTAAFTQVSAYFRVNAQR